MSILDAVGALANEIWVGLLVGVFVLWRLITAVRRNRVGSIVSWAAIGLGVVLIAWGDSLVAHPLPLPPPRPDSHESWPDFEGMMRGFPQQLMGWSLVVIGLVGLALAAYARHRVGRAISQRLPQARVR